MGIVEFGIRHSAYPNKASDFLEAESYPNTNTPEVLTHNGKAIVELIVNLTLFYQLQKPCVDARIWIGFSTPCCFYICKMLIS